MLLLTEKLKLLMRIMLNSDIFSVQIYDDLKIAHSLVYFIEKGKVTEGVVPSNWIKYSYEL